MIKSYFWFLNLQILFPQWPYLFVIKGNGTKKSWRPAFRNIKIAYPNLFLITTHRFYILNEAFAAIAKAKANAEQNLKNAKELF